MTPRPAKNSFSFTERALKNLPTPPREKRKEYYSDSRTPGLRLEVSFTGSMQFFTRIQVRGKSHRYSPGKYPEVSVFQARQWVQNLKADLNRRIPSVMKATNDQLTLGQAFNIYLEERLKLHARRWKDDESLFLRLCTDLSDAKLVEIDRRDTVVLHNKIKVLVGNRTANKVKTLIHRIFAYAAMAEYYWGPNPASGIKSFDENSRDRWIDENEIGVFLGASFCPETDPEIRAVAMLALCTGIRRKNILAIHESWIGNSPIPVIRIPKDHFKGKRVCVIPLIAPALEIIEERLAITGGGHLFPASSATGYRIEIRDRWNRVYGRLDAETRNQGKTCNDCERCDLEHFGPHDLRRTLISWMEACGAPATIRRKMAGHKIPGIDEVYSRAGLITVREWAQKAVNQMFETAGLSMWPQVAIDGETDNNEK